MVVGGYQCRDDRQEFVMEQKKEAIKVWIGKGTSFFDGQILILISAPFSDVAHESCGRLKHLFKPYLLHMEDDSVPGCEDWMRKDQWRVWCSDQITECSQSERRAEEVAQL